MLDSIYSKGRAQKLLSLLKNQLDGEKTALRWESAATFGCFLETQPAAIQLRYLQTMTEIGVEKNTIIVFPLPVDILNTWVKALGRRNA